MDGNEIQVDEKIIATDDQIKRWLGAFSSYRKAPKCEDIINWIKQFRSEHFGIAHRILDSVIVVSETEIHEGYRSCLEGLPNWSRKARDRQGRWFFLGAGGAGESGPAMLRMFREANGLTHERWHEFFVTPTDLPGLALAARDSVVIVDDFAGTGDQMCGYWPILQELIASEASCYLLLTAATVDAEYRISQETELKVCVKEKLGKDKNIFSEEANLFTAGELAALDEYGGLAWKDFPRGFGGCGLCFVLSHKTPNNSLPILHANHEDWVGPFPRRLLQAG